MSKSLEFALRGAGFIPVKADVSVPVLALQTWTPFRPNDFAPVESRPSGALADLYYFWMPGCESCFDSLHDLASLKSDPSLFGVLGIHAVVVESDLTAQFSADAAAAGWTHDVLVDGMGGFAERLGVLGAPGVLVGDSAGKVVARFNGEIDFDSPGFELFVAHLKNLAKDVAAQGEGGDKKDAIALSSVLRAEVKSAPGERVSFLGVPAAGYFFLFALLLICYPMTKSVIQLRKKPK